MEELEKIHPLLGKLVDGKDLTAKEAEELFRTIFLYDTNGYYYAVVLAATHAKGETADELLGLINVHKELGVQLDIDAPADKNTDLSGTGGGNFKTINVSTAASFVVAAAGYKVGKASYIGINSPTGSADILKAFGMDIAKLTKKQTEEAINEVGIAPFYLPYISPKLENRGKASAIVFKEQGLRIRTPLHLVTNAYSPFPTDHRIYGCYSKNYLEVLAELFKKLSFKRTLTFYGEPGIPELSNVGETTIFEQNGNDIKEYTVKPEELGVRRAKEKDIATGGKEQNIKDFVNILKGKGSDAKRDLVAINAGASFYSLKDVNSLKEGTEKALDIMSGSKPFEKFEQVIAKIGDPNLLQEF